MNAYRKLGDWYFSKNMMPYWCVLMMDCCIVLFSGIVGTYFHVGGDNLATNFRAYFSGFIILVLVYAVFYRIFHTYRGIIRFSSYVDLFRIACANLCGSIVALLIGTTVHTERILFPDWVTILLLCIIGTLLMWIVRLMVKASFESINLDNAEPVAIYGTKAGGMSLANSIGSVRDKKYVLKAFVSDGQEMKDTYLLGKRVYMNEKGIAATLKRVGVRTLLVSPLKTERFRNNESMVDELTNEGIKIMMMPAEEEWDGKSELTPNLLHEVEIEDLLPRDPIQVDMNAIGLALTGKSVFITGAAGSIGMEIVRQVAAYRPSDLILVDQAETPMHNVRLMMQERFPEVRNETVVASITDKSHMDKLFSEHRPEYVFHAAAYKHVPMLEDNPAQAVRNNICGTRIIADLAVKYGTKKFVMVSTDKAVNPTNVMGCSKRICEIYCQSLNQAIVDGRVKGETQFVTTRFGNVLGSNGSVIPIFKEQIRNGGPITVTHPDIIRYFMLIPEACKLVLEAGTMGKGGEIFVFDMGKPVKIVNLARRMIKLSGAQNIEIKFTGLRDGEKLYEELLTDAESTIPTVHPKIRVARVRGYDYEIASKNEQRLLEASESFDDMEIVRIMKEIVPEYKSPQSKYAVLD